MAPLRPCARVVLAVAACTLGASGHGAQPAQAAAPLGTVADHGYAWARADLAALTGAGVWRTYGSPARIATRGDLARAMRLLDDTRVAADGLGGTVSDPDAVAPVTARTAAVAVVRSLGLNDEMRGLNMIHTADGRRLKVPAGFGAAVISRELGLRYNYPAADDALEHSDAEPMAVADLARMVSRARGVDEWRRQSLAAYRDITLPVMNRQQRTIVEAALAQTGMPYVWGGDWPTSASPWGAQAHGGFDCSGLVWMAYKGDAASAAINAGADLGGRTADQMAWERPSQRVPVAAVRPGDLIFFGSRGLHTRRGGVEHVGIALGNGWVVHSSGSRAGTSVSRLATYWPAGIAGARRPAVLGTPTAVPPPVTNPPSTAVPPNTAPTGLAPAPPTPSPPSTGYPASPAASGPAIPF